MSRSWRRERAKLFDAARRDSAPTARRDSAPTARRESAPTEPRESAPAAAEAPAADPQPAEAVEPVGEGEPQEAVAGATRRKARRSWRNSLPGSRRTRRRGARVPGPELVGRDFAARPATARRRRPRILAPLVSGALAGLLLLAALHLDLIRMQYALGNALREETRLRNELAQRVVDERGQRDPGELHKRAEGMGLGVAERVIELPLRVAQRDARKERPEDR